MPLILYRIFEPFSPTVAHSVMVRLKLRASAALAAVFTPTLHSVHTKAAITERNRWMVENCDLLIAHLVHERGGAWTAMRMAEKTKKTIVKI